MSRVKVIKPTSFPPPRLVTVYKVLYPGLLPVQQYYAWDFQQGHEEAVNIEHCPGCGQNLKYRHSEHKCAGTLTARPVNNKFSRKTGIPKHNTLGEYLQTVNHPIIFDN